MAATFFFAGALQADDNSAGAFVRLERRDISGKSGRPVNVVELASDGQIVRRDSEGTVRARARLSAAELTALNQRANAPAIQNAASECGRLPGADIDRSELSIEYRTKTVKLELGAHCHVSALVRELLSRLSAAEGKYLRRR